MKPHPLGLRPLGDSFFSKVPNCRDSGLGALRSVPDEILLEIFAELDAKSLRSLAQCSKALMCFAYFEENWKRKVLEAYGGKFSFEGSWRDTYRASAAPQSKAPKSTVQARSMFSDVLFQPHLCAWSDLRPEWLEGETIDRVSAKELSVQEFVDRYERPNRPVIITDLVPKWKASKEWSFQAFRSRWGATPSHAGGFGITLADFVQYSERCAGDDQPLYLFDKAILSGEFAGHYEVPEYFGRDLFPVLGDRRPDFKWLIVGPARSGSSFHQDPNCTSAWNAVIKGSKKWIMFPPSATPPGVVASADGAMVSSPVSLVEWFLNFYDASKAARHVECICKEGEVIFVPSRWWHLALNLEPTIAITQNYVSESNLMKVLAHLSTANGDLVSGCSDEDRLDIHSRFLAALEEKAPEVLKAARERDAAKKKAAESGLASVFKSAETGGAFTFNFG